MQNGTMTTREVHELTGLPIQSIRRLAERGDLGDVQRRGRRGHMHFRKDTIENMYLHDALPKLRRSPKRRQGRTTTTVTPLEAALAPAPAMLTAGDKLQSFINNLRLGFSQTATLMRLIEDYAGE